MFFAKYSASGNDFLITHSFKKQDYSQLAKELCHRHNGIGSDGLIILLPHNELDFAWDFYNSDGSYASMCGNGTRAVCAYAWDFKLASENQKLQTGSGVINITLEEDLGDYKMVESEIGEAKILQTNLQAEGLTWTLLDTGVPHLVAFSEDINALNKETLRTLRKLYNANVDIVSVNWEAEEMSIRTFERGVEDETLACGTGMVAAFACAKEQKGFSKEARIRPANGELLTLREEGNRIFLKGLVKKIGMIWI